MEAIEKATLKTRDQRKVNEAIEAKTYKKRDKLTLEKESKEAVQAQYRKKVG